MGFLGGLNLSYTGITTILGVVYVYHIDTKAHRRPQNGILWLTGVPVGRDVTTDTLYIWAMVEARVSPVNMTVQHYMFVEVSLLHDRGQWDVSCTYEVFNTWKDTTCVHKEYLKLDHERLKFMRFPGHDEVVPLYNMHGQNFGYYCCEAFVRKQGVKGYRCDRRRKLQVQTCHLGR